jgi:prevent-host-death family protein
MESIGVSKLRANLMKILKEIEQGASIDITSHGKTIAKLVPPDYMKKRAKEQLYELGKKAGIYDIMSPVDAGWEAAE